MRKAVVLISVQLLTGIAGVSLADEEASTSSASPLSKAPRSTTAPITQSSVGGKEDSAPSSEGGVDAPRFATEAKWAVAGYNNEEIVYTILITNRDTRILRCTTLLQGSYYENGKKLSISDRQSSTVFPDQQVQAGNWLGMDEKSGATYSVKCRPL
jgi:hypothetical protein